MKNTAIYPGTFDPITNGHLDIIKRASRMFDTVIVAVLNNSVKTPLFPAATRCAQIKAAVKGIANVKVDSFDGLLADYMKRKGARVAIRGLRAVSDLEYEFQIANTNRSLNPGMETVFLMPSEKYTYLASTIVREVYGLGGRLPDMVPAPVEKDLIKLFKGKIKTALSIILICLAANINAQTPKTDLPPFLQLPAAIDVKDGLPVLFDQENGRILNPRKLSLEQRFRYNELYAQSKASDHAGFYMSKLLIKDAGPDRKDAVAAYLYNMATGYKIYNIDDIKKAPLDFIGVFEPLQKAGINPKNVKGIYKKDKEEIYEKFRRDYGTRERRPPTRISYLNDNQIQKLIDLAADGYQYSGRVNYKTSYGGMADFTAIQSRVDDIIKDNEKFAVCFSKTENPQLELNLDTKGRAGNKSRTIMYYQPVNEACGAMSYRIYSALGGISFDGWQNISRHIIRVVPLRGSYYLKNSGGSENFVSPSGKTYPKWDYHAATLLVFIKGGDALYVVIDPLLYGSRPVPLKKWADGFSKENVSFETATDSQIAAAGGSIVLKDNLPADCRPYNL
jgi:pantetheine-phosphate adenylyltransferase